MVSSERENGCQSMSTLVGTRLNTPLSELGASVSVYTRDCLADIDTTSANELLVFATGDEPHTRPQSATCTRGLASPNYTRGLFATGIPMDSYNTDSVTISRGRNAVLTGIVSPVNELCA